MSRPPTAPHRSDVLGHARCLFRFPHRALYWRIGDVVATPKAGAEIMRLLSIGLLCLFLASCTASAKDDAKCRSWSVTGILGTSTDVRFTPAKRTSVECSGMPAKCQKADAPPRAKPLLTSPPRRRFRP